MKTDPVKRKKYLVKVRSHVFAEMIVFANSKLEAWEIAENDMAESFKKLLAEADPHPFIQNIDGYTEALKSNIKLFKDDKLF